MLREEVWESARFLLIGEKRCRMLTIVGRSIQQPFTIPTMSGYRVFRSWLRFAGISNQFLPCPLRYPLGRSASYGVEDSVSCSQCEIEKSPPDSSSNWRGWLYIRYEQQTQCSLDNSNLSGAKLGRKMRPSKGHYKFLKRVRVMMKEKCKKSSERGVTKMLPR